MTDFRVNVSEGNEIVSIALVGELDLATAGRLESELRRVEGGQPPVLIIDMRELRFIDSTGLRFPGPESVHKVFQLALLEKRLDFIEDPSTLEKG
jgi:anti-sigma B factor antagonist